MAERDSQAFGPCAAKSATAITAYRPFAVSFTVKITSLGVLSAGFVGILFALLIEARTQSKLIGRDLCIPTDLVKIECGVKSA